MSGERLRALVLIGMLLGPVHPASAGVILVYHHVSEQTPLSTSVSPERFAEQLDYLEKNQFVVWPVERLLDAAIHGLEPVPDKVVSISFDDAYDSVHQTAWPMLRARGWPFAVFVNTDAVDAGRSPYMDWDALRELKSQGVTIGNHSASHAHLIAREPGESRSSWITRVRSDLEQAQRRIREELGEVPDLFAYPYGEDSSELAEIVGETHRFALVQRSGAVGPTTHPLAVPRFPMATGFDSLERFSLAVNARALPVIAEYPFPPGEGIRGPVQSLRLELDDGNYRTNQIGCFASTGQRLKTEWTPGTPHELEVRVDGLGSTGRNKINCTSPASDGSGDFFWHSFQWVQDAVRD
jgi:peptidoglycan/xylan/chitin deacetylase (PgdA/CDA1 family)